MTEIDELLRDFQPSGVPATAAQLAEVEASMNVVIPDDLEEFLLQHGGGEGFVGKGYLRIDRVEEWQEAQPMLDLVTEWKDIVLIGGDGANDVYGLNRFSHVYVVAERIGEQEPVSLGGTFLEFLRAVHKGGGA